MKTCSVENCDGEHDAKGFCKRHYCAWKTYGDPLIKLRRANGEGGISENGYWVHRIGSKLKRANVLIAESVLGRELPAEAVVHHVNGDRLDNRKSNLVVCPSRAYHNLIHYRMKAMEVSGNASWLKCRICKQYDAPENVRVSTHKRGKRIGKNISYHAACVRDDSVKYRARNRT